MFAPLSRVLDMYVATRSLEHDILVLSRFFDCLASTGQAETTDWPGVNVTKVSSDFGEAAQARTPMVKEKPARIGEFMRRFPAMWQAAAHDEGAHKFFVKWFDNAKKKDGSRAMHLFLGWLQDRLPGTLRCVDLMCVSQVPLVFQGGKHGASFRLQDLPEEQVPLRPDGRFCHQRRLQGYFITTDLGLPEVIADAPSHVTLRHHGSCKVSTDLGS